MTDLESLFEKKEDIQYHVIKSPILAHFNELEVLPKYRELHISSEIGEDDGMWFLRAVRWLESICETPLPNNPIRVVLSTPGG